MLDGDCDDLPFFLGVDGFRVPELALCEGRPLCSDCSEGDLDLGG